MANIKAKVDQLAAAGPYTNGNLEFPTMSQMGDLFTTDWPTRLALAGRVFTLNLGSSGGDTTPTLLTGNAAWDNDQPEVLISATSGWLIPIEIYVSVQACDDDAYDDMVEIGFLADISQSYGSATATTNTPTNHIDGGEAFSGYAGDTVTSDITNPVGSEVLAHYYYIQTQQGTETSGDTATRGRGLQKTFAIPRFFAGPCAIVGYIIGTNTPDYHGYVTFAHLPSSWIKVS